MIWISNNHKFIEVETHPTKSKRIINTEKIEWVEQHPTYKNATNIKTGKGIYTVTNSYEEISTVIMNLSDWIDRPVNVTDNPQFQGE